MPGGLCVCILCGYACMYACMLYVCICELSWAQRGKALCVCIHACLDMWLARTNQPESQEIPEKETKLMAVSASSRNSYDGQSETISELLRRPSSNAYMPSGSEGLGDQWPLPMPGLIPLKPSPPSSSSATQIFGNPVLLQPGLLDLVQVSSDSGSVDSHPNAGWCREYRKQRKRVLSECEGELAEVSLHNAKLRRVVGRLEYRVGKLKAFYIHSVINSRYKCLSSECALLDK